MTQHELFEKMKEEVLEGFRDELADPEDRVDFECLEQAEDIGSLIKALAEVAWDAPCIMALIIRSATGCKEVEGEDKIPMDYDT